jgi:hypothetical protein
MSIYTLNKMRAQPEILASKVDHSTVKIDQDFFQNSDFECPYRRTGANKGILVVAFS